MNEVPRFLFGVGGVFITVEKGGQGVGAVDGNDQVRQEKVEGLGNSDDAALCAHDPEAAEGQLQGGHNLFDCLCA